MIREDLRRSITVMDIVRFGHSYRFKLGFIAFLFACVPLSACKSRTPLHVSFSRSADSIDAYDFAEISANVTWPHAPNPFTDAEFNGWFQTKSGNKKWQVDGFCDSSDGAVFRIRFMPPAPGDYRYFAQYRQGGASKTTIGEFHANDARGAVARSE